MFFPTKRSNGMREKLRSRKGMTLTELLVVLIIVSLIGVSLTVGVGGAARVYRDATRLYEAETLCGTILTYLEDEFRFGRNIQNSGGTVTFDSQAFGNGVKIGLNDGKVQIENAGLGINFPLLGGTAYTSGIQVQNIATSYDGAKKQVAITVEVSAGTGDPVKHTVTVAPLGG